MNLSDTSQRAEPMEPLYPSQYKCCFSKKKRLHLPHASLGTAGRVTDGIEDTRNGPASTEDGRGNRVAQTRDQESTQEGNLVLCEVGVRTLGYRRS